MDEADISAERAAKEAEAIARLEPFKLIPGRPGDCDMCGEWSGRLVGGVCPPCRDKYKMP